MLFLNKFEIGLFRLLPYPTSRTSRTVPSRSGSPGRLRGVDRSDELAGRQRVFQEYGSYRLIKKCGRYRLIGVSCGDNSQASEYCLLF